MIRHFFIFSICFFLSIMLLKVQAEDNPEAQAEDNSDWKINFYPDTKLGEDLQMDVGQVEKLYFWGYNDDERSMYRVSLEMTFPDQIDYILGAFRPLVRRVDKKRRWVKWFHLESQTVGIKQGEALPRPQGWAISLKVKALRAPGIGELKAKLFWNDKKEGGKRYSRSYSFRSVSVKGTQPELSIEREGLNFKFMTVAPKVKIQIKDERRRRVVSEQTLKNNNDRLIEFDAETTSARLKTGKQYTLNAWAVDELGEKSEKQSESFQIPKKAQAPTITKISGPTEYPFNGTPFFTIQANHPDNAELEYRWKLGGQPNSDWSKWSTENEAAPGNLPSGEYTLVTQARIKGDVDLQSKQLEQNFTVGAEEQPETEIQPDQTSFPELSIERDGLNFKFTANAPRVELKIENEYGRLVSQKDLDQAKLNNWVSVKDLVNPPMALQTGKQYILRAYAIDEKRQKSKEQSESFQIPAKRRSIWWIVVAGAIAIAASVLVGTQIGG